MIPRCVLLHAVMLTDTSQSGETLIATYAEGILIGPAQKFNSEGLCIFDGQYKDDHWDGLCRLCLSSSKTTIC